MLSLNLKTTRGQFPVPEDKFCKVCGRRMEWRAAWADCWDEVKTCSSGCRKRGLRREDSELEEALRQLLEERGGQKTICPSELARQRYGEGEWRAQMEPVRMAARRLVVKGQAEILQKNQVVDPSTAKGPIRVRLKKG